MAVGNNFLKSNTLKIVPPREKITEEKISISYISRGNIRKQSARARG